MTAEVAIDVVAAGVEAAAHADDAAQETNDPPPPVTASPVAAPAPPPPSPPSPSIPAGPPFPREQALAAFHASVHRAKLCMGSSKGAVSGAMEFEPRGSVTVTALRGPGVLDPVVAGCVRTCLEQTPVSAFGGPAQTGHFTFDIDPDETSEQR